MNISNTVTRVAITFLAVILLGINVSAQTDTTFVEIQTSKGAFTVALYNDTPIHRDNFIKNVKNKSYDNLLFHRVINRFVVQGGNPNSLNIAADSTILPENSTLLLDNEIMPQKHYHKRGALAAARTPDDVNPEKKSSPMQFYVVTGSYYTVDDLDDIEAESGIKFSKEQRDQYMYKGGTPALDGAYTVFGEVVDGYDTIDDIQKVKTGSDDRPTKNIYIEKMTIVSRETKSK